MAYGKLKSFQVIFSSPTELQTEKEKDTIMANWFAELNPVLQALVATLFTWFVTALGAGLVFFFRTINRKVLDAMLGFAAGVMIAASYWSLLAPAIEMAEESNLPAWIPATVGFLLGGLFLWIADKILPHLHLGFPMAEAEGLKTSWQRSVLLVLAITLHNIPEGLAIGGRLWSPSIRYTFSDVGRCYCTGHWDRHPEFSRRCRCFGAVAAGGIVAFKKLLVWAAIRHSRARCRGSRCGRGYFDKAGIALCPGFCRRCNDLRGGRRIDP